MSIQDDLTALQNDLATLQTDVSTLLADFAGLDVTSLQQAAAAYATAVSNLALAADPAPANTATPAGA